jgi:hypothetical protein
MGNTVRLPHAAQQLKKQILDLKPRAKVEPHGDPDGLGVRRSLIVRDKATAKWLLPILHVIEDPRIALLEEMSSGHVVIHFVTTRIADERTPFQLVEVSRVLSEPPVPEPVSNQTDGESSGGSRRGRKPKVDGDE